MDILSKAANKAGELAERAAATTAQWYKLDGEQRRLAQLRAQALQLRAQIGEEMYKLWQAGSLPPSSLDDLFRSVDGTMAAIERQRMRVEELRAQFSGTGSNVPDQPVTILDAEDHLQVVERAPPPPPVPAAPTRRLASAPRAATDQHVALAAAVACPTCGRPGPAGKPFCGYCGSRLG